MSTPALMHRDVWLDKLAKKIANLLCSDAGDNWQDYMCGNVVDIDRDMAFERVFASACGETAPEWLYLTLLDHADVQAAFEQVTDIVREQAADYERWMAAQTSVYSKLRFYGMSHKDFV